MKYSSFLNIATVVFFIFLLSVIFTSCRDETYTPKPKGYFRIDLPEKHYRQFDTTFPYSFEYPVYAIISPDTYSKREPYWINIDYPAYKGRLYLSYKKVNNNIDDYFEDSHKMAYKHIPKAIAINENIIYDDKNKIFGMTFTIEGKDAASPFQFYVTDSTANFLRGALYFNIRPNNDSLAPVIDFIKDDIKYMISTLRWGNQ